MRSGGPQQIPQSFIDDVLARTDLVEVVGRFVTLRKGGANLLGLCPFHGEKSPSFTVSPSKQFYHCFGCGAHGNALRFLMEHTGAGFIDALESLAREAGLELPRQRLDPQQIEQAQREQQQKRDLQQVLERAATHYAQCLRSDPRAIDYLKGRGLSGRIAATFALGYAPARWRSLASVFGDYADPQLVEAGLVIQKEGAAPASSAGASGSEPSGGEGSRYDRFRDRIMFPIRAVDGRVIGFGGRVLGSGEPKYLNSPETPVFIKGQELYGLHEARQAIRTQGHAIVVEGYMDVVALAQHGIEQAVATLGTACTGDHVRKLVRLTDEVVFAFDGDAAGRRAAARAMEAVLPWATDLRRFRFLFLPAEHDPDSYVREHGAQAFTEAARAAMPLSTWLIERAAEGLTLESAEDRARMLAVARPLWQALPDSALRLQILGLLAERAALPPEAVQQLWDAAGGAPNAAAGARGRGGGGSEGGGERGHRPSVMHAGGGPAFEAGAAAGDYDDAPWHGDSHWQDHAGSASSHRSDAARPRRSREGWSPSSQGPGAGGGWDSGSGERRPWTRRGGARGAGRFAAAPAVPLPTARLPQDHVARLLLTHAGWWMDLAEADHTMLCALPGWHGEAFRWLDRDIQERGPLDWPLLRDAAASQSWSSAARQLVDADHWLVPPDPAELRGAVDALARALARRQAERVLGRG